MSARNMANGETEISLPQSQPHWLLRLLHWLDVRCKPALGWGVLALTLLLFACAIFATEQSRWLSAQGASLKLAWIVLSATGIGWWLYGWRKDRTIRRFFTLRLLWAGLFYFLLGVALVAEIVAHWLPSLGVLIAAMRDQQWQQLPLLALQNLDRLLARIFLWWRVLQAEEPARDDLVMTLIVGFVLWLVVGVSVALIRRTRVGLIAAVPTVALNVALLYWGREDRSAIVITLSVALLLHLWLHQQTLQSRWEALRLDYSPSLIFDRVLSALAAGVVIIALASILPNLYIRPLALWYWQLMSPANQRANELRQQLLPEFVSSTRWRSGGGGGNGRLPNEFMLGAGPQELGNMLVMYVRTNDTNGGEMGYEQEPPGVYMRALTLAEYDGKGWRNPRDLQLQKLPANQRWIGGERSGRRQLLQSVDARVDSPMLFAAGEPVEVSVDSEVEWLPNGELISFRSWQRRYTVLSSVPAVGAETLRSVGDWGVDAAGSGNRLPLGEQLYLQLPASVPPRVHDLAAQLTLTATTLYDKATLLESYLRQFPYDLSVPEPPITIDDVADYFLFDLQRGYCDYYATAFIVMARSLGIPARMATGYAVGSWDFSQMQWTITEAQAHSWPEVYFPQYGWIPFEPTAGRPMLSRVDLSQGTFGAVGAAQSTTSSEEASRSEWNWQMALWLLPLALLLWGGISATKRFLESRRDPWQALLCWGAKHGLPMANGDTILEYGGALSSLLESQAERTPGNDGLRSASREVAAISEAVSDIRYATHAERASASQEVEARWQRIKDFVR